MCISAALAQFSGTKGYIGETTVDGEKVHVLGYQNKAQNLTDEGNALILPFPTNTRMSPENVLDLGDGQGKKLLDDWVEMLRPKPRGLTKGFNGCVSNSITPPVQIFNSGIYTIALSSKPSLINEALKDIPEEKRPTINPELLDWYELKYPGWPIAVCCFNNRQALDSEPLFWWYKPTNEENLFFPGVDAHDGGVPKLAERVRVDHAIIVSTDNFSEGVARSLPPYYKETIPESSHKYLPEMILGQELSGRYDNGDFVISLDRLRRGKLNINRLAPN